METIKRIYTLLLHGNGMKIREIAKELELDAYHVADVLFSSECIQYWYQNEKSLWLAKEGALQIEESVKDRPLVPNLGSQQQIDKAKFLINEPGNCLNIYIEEISKYGIYSDEQVSELFTRYHNGDILAYNLIVKSHLRLVINIARLYKSKGVQLEDVIQEGNIGLLKAIEKFDNSRNNRFAEFAKSWILQRISASIVELPNVVRIPQNQVILHRKLQKIINCYEQTHGYPPSKDEINLNVDTESLNLLYNLPCRLLDTTVFLDDWENVEDDDNKPTDYVLLHDSDKFLVNNLLHFQKTRQKDILKSYFGIDRKIVETLSSIGLRHNLTRERTRQIVISTVEGIQKKYGIDCV